MAKTPKPIDGASLRILTRLQTQARMSNVRLADQVGLSPSACHDRTRALERDGIIRRYIAELDLGKVCSSVTLFVEVVLKDHREFDFTRFTAAMRKRPEVLECFKIGGRIDFMMRVVCRDIDHYSEFSDSLSSNELGVEKCHGHVVLGVSKPFSGLPLETLLAGDD